MSGCTEGGLGAELHVVSKVTTAIPSYGCDVDLQQVGVGRGGEVN